MRRGGACGLVVVVVFTASATLVHAGGSAPVPSDAGATALVKGDSANAVVSFTEALKDTGLSNDRRASLLNDRGVAYMRSGQPKLAIDDFNQAAQLFPEYAAIYNNRGNLLLSLGLVKEAIKDFDRALVLAPGYASAYNNRAGALMRQGQLAEAVQDYSKAAQLNPQSPAPLSGRGRAYLQLSKPYAAIRDFSRAVNADARFASGYRNRAEAKLDVELFDEAIEDLSRAIAFDPNSAEIHLVRGQAYLAASNVPAAIKDFTRALELDPRLVASYQLRGFAHGVSEAYDVAFADLNLAIEMAPRSAIAFAYRAVMYKRTNQIDVGQRDIQTAVKLDESRPEVWWAKGEIDEALSQLDPAIQAYQRALELRPGYKDARDALVRLGVLAGGARDSRAAAAEPEVPELAIDKWRVVLRSGRPVALSQEYPGISVPLEALGEGQPKLLSWEVKKAPFLGIGVLRFDGGVVTTRAGKEPAELAAVIDVQEGKVLTVQQQKLGARVAGWQWEEGKLTIAAADGMTEEFPLRAGRDPVVASPGTRRYAPQQPGYSFWSPFDGPFGSGGSQQKPSRYTAKKKPKSLFDLLFN